ncbi:MAG: hypothetical protein A2252_04595 [Elusimicrobia bacterium RIFOXYA2_FULL_39_19]|nr:MAG: hypothetical protein A2252_04595 [Elusimicrobia bacterium RIFOXYA2_FULL_39_19]
MKEILLVLILTVNCSMAVFGSDNKSGIYYDIAGAAIANANDNSFLYTGHFIRICYINEPLKFGLGTELYKFSCNTIKSEDPKKNVAYFDSTSFPLNLYYIILRKDKSEYCSINDIASIYVISSLSNKCSDVALIWAPTSLASLKLGYIDGYNTAYLGVEITLGKWKTY